MDTFRADVKNLLSGSSTPKPDVPSTTDRLYRVRKSWSDIQSQVGAFKAFDNAKRYADDNPGYAAFDENGTKVYGGTADTAYEIYIVIKGDSLWKIAAIKLGNGSRYPEIKSLNGLTSDIIYPGQKLKILR
ncbi:LysM peptidoglycan-binding domain-containing protein [Lachnospiraceae bacterium ZAX-1]